MGDLTRCAGRGCGPLKALLAPHVAIFDALLGTTSGDVRRCLLVTAQCRLPACLSGVEHGHLIAGGVLGDDVVWVLERASDKITLSTLPRALLVVSGQHAGATLASLVTNLRFVAPSLPSPLGT
jgi:hypothetical protein